MHNTFAYMQNIKFQLYVSKFNFNQYWFYI